VMFTSHGPSPSPHSALHPFQTLNPSDFTLRFLTEHHIVATEVVSVQGFICLVCEIGKAEGV
jgi:hypothetical protein